MKNLFLAALIVLIVSCTKSSTSSSRQNNQELLETDMIGSYQALMAPINPEVSGHLNAALTLVREDDNFVADIRFSGGPASILHTQNIHVGERCPDASDDRNGDGFVDAEEGFAAYKEIIIPLDDDLNSQRMGGGTFPVANEFGFYLYSHAASYEKLFRDLKEEDINTEDDISKLNGEPGLVVKGKVVVIYGVPETATLPDTVSGRGRLSKFAGLPIACGIIRRQTTVPGRIDDDTTDIPVPEDGETVGGSSGADDGAIFTHSGSTTGDYGDDDGDS